MKIESKQPEGFNPITITLETVEEANYLRALIAPTYGEMERPFGLDGDFAFGIYNHLDDRVRAHGGHLHRQEFIISLRED
jgi:hypothetical protein